MPSLRGSGSLSAILTALLLLSPAAANDSRLRLTEGTNLTLDVSPADGRIAMDLLGSLWLLPASGGYAERIHRNGLLIGRPRWSPDGRSILVQAETGDGSALWRVDVADRRFDRLTPADAGVQHGSWHPSGVRILFAAERGDSGLDLWERDLATGLEWRLSDHPGDESSPAWSADGRHLAYVHRDGERWRLMLRRFAQAPRVLVESTRQLLAPAWRPDNTLLTYLAEDDDGSLSLRMVILSDPPLERLLADDEDFFAAPAAWVDRSRFVYAADGVLKSRHFAERDAQVLPFTATIDPPARGDALGDGRRALPAAADGGTLVVRAARLYDGESARYRRNVDILIEDGRIAAIERQRPRGDALVIDIGNTTVLPGLIDAFAGLPADDARSRALLLYFGVTTIVTPDTAGGSAEHGNPPGPRILLATNAADAPGDGARPLVRLVTAGGAGTAGTANVAAWRSRGVPLLAESWASGLLTGADLLPGSISLPASPLGRRYADVAGLTQNGPLLVSGLADAATPGLGSLYAAAPATLLGRGRAAARRFVASPEFVNGRTGIIVGSRASGLPPGIATQAELLALTVAGFAPHEALHAATGRAATALGLDDELGRVKPGLRADLLLVAGDPLRNVAAASEVVGLVLDGRFLSTARLLDEATAGVE